jgi:hypothetical protein
LKVPTPTCSVRRRTSNFARISGVKCNPAVGAATEPSFRAKTVW